MNAATLKKVMLTVTIVWMSLAAALAIATFGGLLDRTLFQWLFAGGFVIYSVAITLMTKWLIDSAKGD